MNVMYVIAWPQTCRNITYDEQRYHLWRAKISLTKRRKRSATQMHWEKDSLFSR